MTTFAPFSQSPLIQIASLIVDLNSALAQMLAINASGIGREEEHHEIG